jgi:ankyrin repeat protein
MKPTLTSPESLKTGIASNLTLENPQKLSYTDLRDTFLEDQEFGINRLAHINPKVLESALYEQSFDTGRSFAHDLADNPEYGGLTNLPIEIISNKLLLLRDHNGNTPLQTLLEAGGASQIKKFANAVTEETLTTKNKYGHSALTLAAQEGGLDYLPMNALSQKTLQSLSTSPPEILEKSAQKRLQTWALAALQQTQEKTREKSKILQNDLLQTLTVTLKNKNPKNNLLAEVTSIINGQNQTLGIRSPIQMVTDTLKKLKKGQTLQLSGFFNKDNTFTALTAQKKKQKEITPPQIS